MGSKWAAMVYHDPLFIDTHNDGIQILINNEKVKNISYPKLSYFTLDLSKYTIRDLEDWRVSMYNLMFRAVHLGT